VDTGEIINPTDQHPDADGMVFNWQHDPAWSPQSNRIAFTWGEIATGDIYTVEPDGANLRRLTEEENAFNPTWSPDGTQLLFLSRHEGRFQIYVINADGTNLHSITAERTPDVYDAAWSPDGTQIVYWDRYGISVLNADGTNARWLAKGVSPSWSPDGREIAFVSQEDYPWQIYIMNRDGSGLYPLTNTSDPVDGYPPAWRPRP
jgi:TolB protein